MSKSKTKVIKRRMLNVWRMFLAMLVIAFIFGGSAVATQLTRSIQHTPANCVLLDNADLICN